VLKLLTKPRLVELARVLGVGLPLSATKDLQVERLGGSDLPTLARLLTRDELKLVCRAHGLDDTGRARTALAARLLGNDAGVLPTPLFAAPSRARDLPEPGDILQVRHRQYLVEDVILPGSPDEQTRVRGVCLDDDNQGRPIELFWELELGARVLAPETHGLGEIRALDPPRRFAAYLHALRWSSVTATDARLFQAPFRAGIQLMNHQLTPLKKALELPRANLFIADDVGLGKTIEAGLVLQELLLRQQVDLCLIVAPASVCLQWRDEMQKRFGLRFEIYSRAFVALRRKERGFGVNPWSTHTRFIISYHTLRRPEYLDPLLQRLGERARKSILILDEAHTAAPQSASKYAVDSHITRVVRELAPRFDNRLFLSATPHNGHSNSFSALCELLDPQRFTRGVRPSRTALETVMVRRLKSDLRELGVGTFPRRKVVQLDVGRPDSPEVVLSGLLADYARLMKPARGRGRLVFVNLQKRLLSSIEAFRRTLDVHARAVAEGRARTALALHDLEVVDDDEYGPDDEDLEVALDADADASSRLLPTPEGQARKLLADMQRLAQAAAPGADAKVDKLVGWIRENQCPAVRLGGAAGKGAELAWSDRRLLVFTEYGDTKRWLLSLLRTAVEGTRLGDERILELHGGMSDEQRDEIQRAFNDPAHPVRILLATDAAREGVNLQGCCQDLLHFDVPWNPARMEQRNGRIDRTLQPEPEVRCAYFYYPDRREDIVLHKLLAKVETIQAELGSLGAVVLDRLADVMEEGIDDATETSLDAVGVAPDLRVAACEELETQRELARLRRDIDENAAIAKASRKLLEFEPALLRGVVDVGLELAGAGPLQPAGDETFLLPVLGEGWQSTLDTLRRPRGRDEGFWEWRDAAPPQPVVFRPPPKVNSPVVQLHLSHPFVQRILGRFLAQGFSAHDLARVTALRNPHDDEVIALAFGRLSLFGPGATRLHDELVAIAARRPEAGPRPEPLPDKDQAKALADLDHLLGEPERRPIGAAVDARLAASAPADFAALWEAIKEEADGRAHDAERKLVARADAEAAALARLLEEQQKAIEKELGRRQLALDFSESERDQREQYERDRQHMAERLAQSRSELETEPRQIRSLYQVALRRLEPVGLVYLWPETRG
jgi:hypothetical protein